MPGIGVITNPRSRMNKRDPGSMRRLGYLIGSRGSAEATRDLDDLYRVAEEFKRAEIDILGINGGDGTIHHTLTAFVKTYGDKPLPAIAILRGGTMNTIANSFGIKGEPSQLLFDVVDKYHNGEAFDVLEKEILAVGDAYGCIFGTGVIYNFLEAYYGTGAPSPAVAARLVGRTIGSALVGGPLVKRMTRRFRARVIADGDAWARDDFLAVAAACCEQIGLGFRPFYRWNEHGVFQILGIHVPSPLGFIGELPRIHRGKPMRRDKAIDVLAREVRFEHDGAIEYVIDGDRYSAQGSLRLSVGPRLRFLRPNLASPVAALAAGPTVPALPPPSV